MESWRKQLARQPGEGTLRRGWRLSRAGWRLLRGNRAIATLAFGVAMLGAALTVAETLYAYNLDGAHRDGDRWAIALLAQGVYLVVASFAFAAMTIVADTTIEGSPISAPAALGEAWERRGPLLGWGLVAIGFLFLVAMAWLTGAPWYAIRVSSLTWTAGTVFVIPTLVLEADSIGEAISTSLRTAVGCWRQTFAGLAAATSQVFALLLYRDVEQDLPAVEPESPDPLRWRRQIAIGVAVPVGLSFLIGIIGSLAEG